MRQQTQAGAGYQTYNAASRLPTPRWRFIARGLEEQDTSSGKTGVGVRRSLFKWRGSARYLAPESGGEIPASLQALVPPHWLNKSTDDICHLDMFPRICATQNVWAIADAGVDKVGNG